MQDPDATPDKSAYEQAVLFAPDEDQFRQDIDAIDHRIAAEDPVELAEEERHFRAEREHQLGATAVSANGLVPDESGNLGALAEGILEIPRSRIQVVERALSSEEYANIARQAEAAKQATSVAIIRAGRLTVASRPWRGEISVSKLVTNPEQREIVAEAKQRINEFYVPVGKNAPSRCVDGRFDDQIPSHNLGPQVPGGAPGAAIAYRLGVDRDDLTRGNYVDDVEAIMDIFETRDIPPGVHTDEFHVGKKEIGCKFISDLDEVVKTMTDSNFVDDHKRLVKGLMGANFNRDNYLRVMGAATVLNGRSSDYFRGREEVLQKLAKRSEGSVSVLKGTHKEVLVAVNFVPGTTLDSRGFAKEFGGYQAFGYDVWRSLKMAEELLPNDEEQTQDRQRFVMARIMTTVSTLMALTDGSQDLVMRVPKNKAA